MHDVFFSYTRVATRIFSHFTSEYTVSSPCKSVSVLRRGSSTNASAEERMHFLWNVRSNRAPGQLTNTVRLLSYAVRLFGHNGVGYVVAGVLEVRYGAGSNCDRACERKGGARVLDWRELSKKGRHEGGCVAIH